MAMGNVIFREGDPADCMYVVLSGTVVIGSHEKNIEVITPGMALEFLGVIDAQPRTTTARADGRCELALLDRRRFRYMVEEVPNFVWFVMGELAHRLRATIAAL
jgi:CRP/FNR family cyclic AMP-dependent transcriptional regulator